METVKIVIYILKLTIRSLAALLGTRSGDSSGDHVETPGSSRLLPSHRRLETDRRNSPVHGVERGKTFSKPLFASPNHYPIVCGQAAGTAPDTGLGLGAGVGTCQ
ncbi:hypothetical protein F1880_004258 [Penicillium rolfsii]|nr:hypothetical protein F1880_004258 [Penicillium rolfsii]